MNPLDSPFEEKVHLLTSTNNIPCGKGVKFLHFVELNLKQILQRTGNELTLNAVRAEGLDLELVSKFKEHIDNGKYVYTFQQPVVCFAHGEGITEKLYELVCGEHRLQAHKDANRDTILVAVVEFDSLEDKIIFQSNENDPEDTYIKHPRTEGDVLLTLKKMVDEEIIDINDDKSINARLIRLNQKTTDFPKLREQLREKFDIINAVKTYSDKQRSEWCKTYMTKIQISSRKKIVPIDGVSYITKTFKGGKGPGGLRDLDYDPRCFFDTCSILQSGKTEKVAIIASFNKCDSQKMSKIRDYKRNKLMQEWLDRACSIVDDYRAGKIDPVKDSEFLFMPQINNVDSMEKFS